MSARHHYALQPAPSSHHMAVRTLRFPGYYRRLNIDRTRPASVCPWRWHNCNCDRQHYEIIMPNMTPWITNGRASNCCDPSNSAHRCWSLRGPIDRLTVGPTAHGPCGNSGGSIDIPATISVDPRRSIPGWHGFIRDGRFDPPPDPSFVEAWRSGAA